MSAVVFLGDIVDALEMQLEESSSFLDPDTGRIETVSDDLLRQASAKHGTDPEPLFRPNDAGIGTTSPYRDNGSDCWWKGLLSPGILGQPNGAFRGNCDARLEAGKELAATRVDGETRE